MRPVMEKLRSHKGETLVEVLVSILVAGLSVLLLAGMISTASRFNGAARRADGRLYEELSAAEAQGPDSALGRAGAVLTVGGVRDTISVTVYGLPDGLCSYAEGGAP